MTSSLPPSNHRVCYLKCIITLTTWIYNYLINRTLTLFYLKLYTSAPPTTLINLIVISQKYTYFVSHNVQLTVAFVSHNVQLTVACWEQLHSRVVLFHE